MDAIASAHVSKFMGSYVNSDYLDPSSDPQHLNSLEQSLVELRLVSNDLARVQTLLGEIGSQRAFIQWLGERIQAAEQRGEDTYLLRWDRGHAGAKVRELQEKLSGLLGPSLQARLVSSREAFRQDYLIAGTRSSASTWAGDDAGIQDALDGMLISDADQAVVNHYLYSLDTLQRDSAWLAQALDNGGTLARSPQRREFEATLSHWQQQARAYQATVMGLLSGEVDASRVDPVPWTDRRMDPASARPPLTAAERKAFQVAEDTARLDRLVREARSIEDALAALDVQRKRQGGPPSLAAEQLKESSQHRYGLVQKARLLHECMGAVRARLEMLRKAPLHEAGAPQPVDLAVAHALRKLETLNTASTASPVPAPPLQPLDEALYQETLLYLRQALPAVIQSHESLAGMADRLAEALVVPRGFRLSESQRAEWSLLRSQRVALLEQQQLVRQELAALKALIDQTERAQRQSRPFDHDAFSQRHTAWEADRAARLQGEGTRQGALSTPVPAVVAWKKSVQSSQSRAPTVTANHLLSPETNASVRAQVEADRKASAALRQSLRAREASIRDAEVRLDLLSRPGTSAADKADIPTAQAGLNALKSVRGALASRLSLLTQRQAAGEALLTSTSEGVAALRQQDIATITSALPNAWLKQLREEQLLAQAQWAAAQRHVSRLQGTAGTANRTLVEAEKLLAYRAAASAYAAARVVEQEVQRGTRGQTPTLESATQALAATREAMQAAYFNLAQVRLVYRSDSLSSQLQAEERRGAPLETLQRLRREVEATQTAWPRNVTPYPETPAARAAAVQARFGDDLPE